MRSKISISVILDSYNGALKEMGINSIELGVSNADSSFHYAIYETKKKGQIRRKQIVRGLDVESLFYQVASNYNINCKELVERANNIWKNISE